jgi:hypothetical protein
MTHRILTVFVVVLTLTPAAGSAQELFEEGEWTVTPGLGFALDPDGDVSPAVIAAVAYSVTPTLIVEGELGHLFDLAPGDADVDSSLTSYHASVLYFVETPYVVTPYLAGGIGIGHLSHDVTNPSDSFSATEIGFNLGGGAAYPLREGVLIRGDVRYFNHIDEVPWAFRFVAAVTFGLRR